MWSSVLPQPVNDHGAVAAFLSCSTTLGPWFDVDPGARIALAPDGRLLAANPAAQALLSDGRIGVRATGQLQFGTSVSEAQFSAALFSAGNGGAEPQRLILKLKDGQWASADLRLAAEGEVLVLAFHYCPGSPPDTGIEAIAEAFHLTRTETMVLKDLCGGECPKSVARLHDMSEHTVRAHLRAIYAKMGAKGLTNAVVMAVQLLS